MAQDTIEVLKVLFPKKALINGKLSEYKNIFWKIFEEELFPLTRISLFLLKLC